jgi:DNA-binding beta-propeller fold protein YncE
VFVIDTATNSILKTISTGDGAVHIAATPNGKFMYVGAGYAGMKVIDTTTDTVVATVPFDLGLDRIAVGVALKSNYQALVQEPINTNGTSVFNVKRGVVPVKFTLTVNGVATCQLPPATITLTRTAGGTIGPSNESVYTTPADTGSSFRISGCQYLYNLGVSTLGIGTYQVEIKIEGSVVGTAQFGLN